MFMGILMHTLKTDKHVFRLTQYDYLFGFLLVIVLFIQYWKATRGMGINDEHFYIAEGYRFYQGDSLISDDWHIAQLISIFLSPLVALFRQFSGNNDGIVLAFRHYYIVFVSIIGIAIYIRFRDKKQHAILASLIYMLFTPFSIMALSYNTMSVGFLLLSMLVFPIKTKNRARAVISGLFYACAVINTPYLSILYFVLLIYFCVKKEKVIQFNYFWLSIGVFLAAALFFIILFSRATVSGISAGLKHIIDPSHSQGMYRMFANSCIQLIRAFGWVMAIMVLEPILALICRKADETVKLKLVYSAMAITIIAIVWIAFIHPYQSSFGGSYALLLFPYTVFGMTLIIIFHINNSFSAFFYISLFHSLTIAISSNVGPRSFCGPLITACVMTTLIAGEVLRSNSTNNILSLVTIAALLFFKITAVYSNQNDFSVELTNGPLKGLYDSSENAIKYASLLNDVQEINSLDDNYAMFVSPNTWLYLASEKKSSKQCDLCKFLPRK
jgi:hypothetical protein